MAYYKAAVIYFDSGIEIEANLAISEAQDIMNMSLAVISSAELAISEAQDIMNMSLAADVLAELAISEAQDIMNMSLAADVLAELAISEAQDIVNMSLAVDVLADLAISEAQDIANMSLAAISLPSPQWAGGYYISRRRLLEILEARLKVTEAQDTAKFTAEVIPLATAKLAVIENPDIAKAKTLFDYTDDEIVMMLMSAAWEEEEILLS